MDTVRSPYGVFGITVFLLLCVGWLDYTTGPELGFFVFYFIPLTFMAWHGTVLWCLCFSALASVVWLAADHYAGHHYSSPSIGYWNAGARLIAFVFITLIITRIKYLLYRERQLNEELSRAMAEIQVLSGLLPICASCKKIRDEQGAWHHVEIYISKRSEATFSHGICPECIVRLYSRELE
jgi:hypothetical protein